MTLTLPSPLPMASRLRQMRRFNYRSVNSSLVNTIATSCERGKRLTESKNSHSMTGMKTKTTGLIMAFCFLAGAACLAADPQMGTWKLNEAKSKITPGTLKNTQVVYSSMLGQVKIKSDGIDANGKPIHVEWSGKFDGKDYPVSGDPNSD